MTSQPAFPLNRFRAVVAAHAQSPALVFEGRTTTYGELDCRSNQCARALLAAGVKAGDRVCVMAKNNDAFFVLLLGAMKARACLTPINWRLAVPEVAFVLKDSGAKLIVHSSEYAQTVREAAKANDAALRFVDFDDTDVGEAFDQWISAHPEEPVQMASLGDDDLIQLYTSGTTGFPKGVQLTHDNYRAFIDCVLSAGWGRWESGKTSLIVSPLFHVAGVNVGMISLLQGVRTVLIREPTPADLVRTISAEKVAYVFLVPTLINMMLQTAECAEADFSALERICYGASPISDDVLRKAIARFQCKFSQLYGLTETTGGGTELAHEDHRGELLRSCGRAVPGFEIRIVDANGTKLNAGEVGEIQIRSRGVMRSYWNRTDATAAAIDGEGWFRTGDAGFMNDEGFVFIHDRMKDMIVSGGENIYPAEVENAIFGHPDLADVAVIGVPDEKWGEAVKAIVVPKLGAAPSAESVIAHARARIAGYKVPKSVDFTNELPRNPSGKVLRRELREKYWKGRDRRVA
jgi:acyl-CoA synthetase (AMP-forming)/AMP-acid ligase II